jgi:hypothetical protein
MVSEIETEETPYSGTKKGLAFLLFDQGKRPSDPEVKALGLKPKSTYTYFQEHKKLRGGGDGTTIKPSGSDTAPKAGPKAAPLVVGKITITPENWGMDQYGAILILDTYNKAKRDFNYGGTIGDFIQDIFVLFRRIQNYEEEVEYVGPRTGEGGVSSEQDGSKSFPAVVPIKE